MKVGDKIHIRIELMSGVLDSEEAVVTKYEPPPPGPMWDGCLPIIWVRPKGFEHNVSITESEIIVSQ